MLFPFFFFFLFWKGELSISSIRNYLLKTSGAPVRMSWLVKSVKNL